MLQYEFPTSKDFLPPGIMVIPWPHLTNQSELLHSTHYAVCVQTPELFRKKKNSIVGVFEIGSNQPTNTGCCLVMSSQELWASFYKSDEVLIPFV